jgi:phosphoribosylanthranilate isomerase
LNGFFGLYFYEKSPRFVLNHLSLEEISEINHQGKVGVFVNETVEKIVEISEKQNSILFNCTEMKMKNLS